MSEFSDRPFVAGSLIGVRTFRVDELGRLTGVTHKDVWRPGENEAVCHKADADDQYRRLLAQYVAEDRSRRSRFLGGGYSYGGGIMPSPVLMDELDRAQKQKSHQLASVDCQCGFYAYFDGANDYLNAPSYATGGMVGVTGFVTNYGEADRASRIAAIVEGYGVCTVGTRGFRASKARILAVVDPKRDTAKETVAFDKVRRNYPDVRVFDTEREAVATFPLTDPTGASPEDEDFWSRSAS